MSVSREPQRPEAYPRGVRTRGDYRQLALLICGALGFAGLAFTVVLVAMHAPAVAVGPVAGVAAAAISAVVAIMVTRR